MSVCKKAALIRTYLRPCGLSATLLISCLCLPAWASAQNWDTSGKPSGVATSSGGTKTVDVAQDPSARCFATLTQEEIRIETCQQSLEELTAAPTPTADTVVNMAQINAAIGTLYLAKNDLIQARTYLDQARQLAPNDAIVQSNFANLLLREGQFAAAIETYNTVITNGEIDPINIPALYLNRALALRATGRYDEESKDFALYTQLINADTPAADVFPIR